jgi:predicted transcriptional regulator
MIKTRKTITVDPRVWAKAEAEAERLRVSNSWVAETALRQMLRMDRGKPRKSKAAAEPPPAA